MVLILFQFIQAAMPYILSMKQEIKKKIKAFVNFHEQTSGLAAEAYGRFKNLGACCVGAGPAATNLSSAIMSAYCDSIPVVFVTGQVGMFHKIQIKIFILNNECLGNTKFPVLKTFKNTLGNDKKGGYSWPDFCKVAKAYKIEGHEVNSKTKLKSFLNKILKSKKSNLTNVKMSPNQFMLETGI